VLRVGSFCVPVRGSEYSRGLWLAAAGAGRHPGPPAQTDNLVATARDRGSRRQKPPQTDDPLRSEAPCRFDRVRRAANRQSAARKRRLSATGPKRAASRQTGRARTEIVGLRPSRPSGVRPSDGADAPRPSDRTRAPRPSGGAPVRREPLSRSAGRRELHGDLGLKARVEDQHHGVTLLDHRVDLRHEAGVAADDRDHQRAVRQVQV